MKLYLVTMHADYDTSSYVLGVYSSSLAALGAAQEEEDTGKYGRHSFEITVIELNKNIT